MRWSIGGRGRPLADALWGALGGVSAQEIDGGPAGAKVGGGGRVVCRRRPAAAIIAYLQSLPKKPDATGKTQWGVIGRAMLAMGLMRVEAPMTNPAMRGPAETPTAPVALGRYVAQAQCSGCHGPAALVAVLMK